MTQVNEVPQEQDQVVVLEQTAKVEEELAGVPEGWVGINEAAEAADYTPQYVRQMLIRDDIRGVKVHTGAYPKWYVDVEALMARPKNTRIGGMRNYILRMDPEHEDELREELDARGIEFELRFAYQSKDKDEDEDENENSPEPAVEEEEEFGF